MSAEASGGKPRATRNYHQLPFGSLDPKRFEDLVRQLAYGFRQWKSIEATGRTGSDMGADVRAIEFVPSVARDLQSNSEEDEEEAEPGPTEERVWIVQCKRERPFGPKRVREAVRESLDRLERPPYGFILATSADLSVAAREALREELAARRVEEFYAWGAGELEDRLYQPRFDGLLFAYFGISLQVRRRSLRTDARTALTLKRQLVKALGPVNEASHRRVLIRDASDEHYPFLTRAPVVEGNIQWQYFTFHRHEPPGFLMFELHRFHAYVDHERGVWDALDQHDLVNTRHWELFEAEEMSDEERLLDSRYRKLWYDLPEENRATYHVYGVIPYERVVAVDEIGDAYNDGPHLLVERIPGGYIFEDALYFMLEPNKRHWGTAVDIMDLSTRIEHFPQEPPKPSSNEPPADPGILEA